MLKKYGFKVKNVIVWDKIVHGLNYMNYAYTYELIIFFVKGNFLPNNKPGVFYKDVWHIKRDMNFDDNIDCHETVKQINVVRKPILHGSIVGDVVLDPFLGSGTTAVACKQLDRNFIGFEISKEYVNVANNRLGNACHDKRWFV